MAPDADGASRSCCSRSGPRSRPRSRSTRRSPGCLGVDADELRRLELGTAPLPSIDLDDWAGIILGGGAFNASDPEETQVDGAGAAPSATSARLLDDVIARDFPFLGACYGIGSIGRHQGAVVDRSFPEPVGPVSVELTDAGMADPLFAGMPRAFRGVRRPQGGDQPAARPRRRARDLRRPRRSRRSGSASTSTRPSSTPSSTSTASCTRIAVYAHHGYFDPSEQEALGARGGGRDGDPPDDDPAQLRRAVPPGGRNPIVTDAPRGCPSVQHARRVGSVQT